MKDVSPTEDGGGPETSGFAGDGGGRSDVCERRHVYLVGFMGAGKSTVGRLLAQKLGRRWVDMDAEIGREAQKSVAAIFAAEGEEGFRRREAELLARLAEEPSPLVVSTGGGVVLRRENRERLRASGVVVYLEVPFSDLWKRLTEFGGSSDRPLFAPGDAEALRRRLRAREALYREVADLVYVNLDTPERAALDLAGTLRSFLQR
ncbi:MAG: Shikimate kinase I [Brockia lithotrophica]|uniref:Shikimate kinase n=1 Tax=Brockia lithotrophica TaxID=933949 RepID=A0A2T5G697_9BACL|nr:shikimate kinase [Brockia lithotrophica]PTQ51711.1 MAG: Shikimate kinase I [Brockia lithotrophica]